MPLLTACDGGGGGGSPAPATSGGLVNSLVSGVAAGAGMAAGHHMINGAVNKWQNRPRRQFRQVQVFRRR